MQSIGCKLLYNELKRPMPPPSVNASMRNDGVVNASLTPGQNAGALSVETDAAGGVGGRDRVIASESSAIATAGIATERVWNNDMVE